MKSIECIASSRQERQLAVLRTISPQGCASTSARSTLGKEGDSRLADSQGNSQGNRTNGTTIQSPTQNQNVIQVSGWGVYVLLRLPIPSLLLPIAPSVSCSCLYALYARSSKLPPSPSVSHCLPMSTTRLSLLLNFHPQEHPNLDWIYNVTTPVFRAHGWKILGTYDGQLIFVE